MTTYIQPKPVHTGFKPMTIIVRRNSKRKRTVGSSKAIHLQPPVAKGKNVVARMRYMATQTDRCAKMRAKELLKERRRNRKGEPMYKRAGPWRNVVYAQDVADYIPCHISTAYRHLRFVARELKKKRSRYISPKEFCRIMEIDYETFQDFINQKAAEQAERISKEHPELFKDDEDEEDD
jgi:hypothetical protein